MPYKSQCQKTPIWSGGWSKPSS